MTVNKIFVDASEAAKIIFSDGTAVIHTITLQEAVIEFEKLDQAKKEIASIKTESGLRLCANEVSRLHYK